MTSFLTQVQGFTPLIEVMVQEVGIIQAAVYGVVWRYCQRSDRVCTASHETLGKALGLSRGTVQRHIKELCEAGYLRDTTPERKNRPHVYADTGRAQIVGMVSAKVTVSEKYSGVSESDTQVYQKDTRRDCETTEETHGADAPPAPADAIAKPPAYRCKHCQNVATVSLEDDSVQGYAYCTSCGEAYFINEKPITRYDIAMMKYLGWDCPEVPDVETPPADAIAEEPTEKRYCRICNAFEYTNEFRVCLRCHREMENGDRCIDCEKPTATSAQMPHIAEVCTCKQEAALVEAFGDPPERPERKPPPHWHELVQDPRVLWGNHSDTFNKLVQQYGENGVKVKFLGYDWEQLTKLEPDWEDKNAVKSWSSGLAACLTAAGGDASIVLDATRKAIEDGLTISKPYSAVEVTRALCGERKRDKAKDDGEPALYSDEWYTQQMENDPQAAAFS